jgi:O-methyltransferase
MTSNPQFASVPPERAPSAADITPSGSLGQAPRAAAARDAYIELLKLSLLDLLGPTTTRAVPRSRGNVHIETVPERERDQRLIGRDWPANGLTMIGWERLTNLQRCMEDVIARGVHGDMIEAGAWRGGATIFMRGLLKVHGVDDRIVWVADSFAGLPPPDAKSYPPDARDPHHTFKYLVVPLEQVKRNFERYGLLDECVRFAPGWFRDTLTALDQERWSLIRLDGDMYESTLLALEHLYPRLSPGGYVLIDDYGALSTCRQAVHDFRAAHGVDEEIHTVDWTGVFWRKGEG